MSINLLIILVSNLLGMLPLYWQEWNENQPLYQKLDMTVFIDYTN